MEELKEKLEKRRLDFLAYFKKARIINFVLLFVSVIAFIGIFVLCHKMEQDTIGFIACIVIVIALFAYVNIVKKKINRYTFNYIKNYYEDTTKVMLKSIGVETFESLPEDSLTIEKISNARIMKDVCFTRSRNIVHFILDDKEIEMGDLLFKTTNPEDVKKTIIAFCGKFIQFKSKKNLHGRTLIYRKAKQENCFGPSDLDGLDKILDNEKLLVYSSDKDFELEKEKNIFDIINNIEINEDLYDLTVAANGDVISIALSYSDKLMAIPLYEETPINSFLKAQNDLAQIKNIIQEL